jgi:uncharacterized lipoprotein YbaY
MTQQSNSIVKFRHYPHIFPRLICWLILLAGCGTFVAPIQALFQDPVGVDRWLNWNNQSSANPPIRDRDRDGMTPSPNFFSNQPWTLGVRGINTRTGVLVRSVDSNSAANRAGIREGDSIITVAGSQVGLVGTRLIELEPEINRLANSTGQISLVTHSPQTGGVQLLNIQLQAAQVALTGVISELNRLNLPSDALINLQIVNVSRPHLGVRNGSLSLRPTGSSVLSFTIPYDPDFIYPQDRYEVSANVTSRGNLLFHSDRNYPILTLGNPARVDIRLVSASTNFSNSGGDFANRQEIDRYIETSYRRYLRRNPYYIEHATLLMDPQLERRLRSLPLDLMASQEYYDASGNNDAAWITRVFEEMVGRKPLASELENWRRRFVDLRYSRTALLAQLESQVRG